MINKKILVLSMGALVALSTSISYAENYYVGGRVISVNDKAKEMDSSHRPGIGSFVKGKDKKDFINGSIAAGYQFDSNWRVELEYVFPHNAEYTSGSSIFATSLNHHKIKSQRFMINGYKDFVINDNFSVFGTLGVGIASLKSSGWQGVSTRQYGSKTENNIAYSIGAGVTYTPVKEFNIDLGYRYVDQGKAESGWNNFGNARGLQDEKMKARIVSNEIFLGFRYNF